MAISSSIVLYKNEPKQIDSVLNSLAESSIDINVSIIDNSPSPIRINLDLLPKAKYIKTRENIGFGAAHNLAIKESLENGVKYHLVLNPDVFFSPGIIEELFRYMEDNPDVGNVMPQVRYLDGTNQYLAKLLPTPSNLAVRLFHRFLPEKIIKKSNYRYELHFLLLDNPIQVPSLSGCFMFLRCDALRKSGLFDERFFLYFEDFDLVRRISSHYKIMYYPEVQINHHFERASRKNIAALASHLYSGAKYFNKWGWLKDEHRESFNAKTISEIIRNSRQSRVYSKALSRRPISSARIKSVALITNQALSMLNFRGRMIEDMVARGVRVYALAPDYIDWFRDKARALGAVPVDYDLDRIGINPARDSVNLFKLTTILTGLQPDAVLNNFIKPVIYGSWAAKRSGVKNIYSMISGLGYIYTQSPSKETLKSPFFREVTSLLYKSALARNRKVFFHNPDDQGLFVSQGIVEMDKTVRIFGSGVDLDYYFMNEIPKRESLTFVLAARLLIEKGIREFIAAAGTIKKIYPASRFILLGGKDINPAGLKEKEVGEWVKSGVIEWPRQVEDVRPFLAESSVFVLPSWREGTPRSTLEAMAIGRAIITTDVPGCRETVYPDPETEMFERLEQGKLKIGVNGIMVPVRDARALSKAMEYMIKNPRKVVEMGRQSRKIAEEHYDVRKVNKVILREMGIV